MAYTGWQWFSRVPGRDLSSAHKPWKFTEGQRWNGPQHKGKGNKCETGLNLSPLCGLYRRFVVLTDNPWGFEQQVDRVAGQQSYSSQKESRRKRGKQWHLNCMSIQKGRLEWKLQILLLPHARQLQKHLRIYLLRAFCRNNWSTSQLRFSNSPIIPKALYPIHMD